MTRIHDCYYTAKSDSGIYRCGHKHLSFKGAHKCATEIRERQIKNGIYYEASIPHIRKVDWDSGEVIETTLFCFHKEIK